MCGRCICCYITRLLNCIPGGSTSSTSRPLATKTLSTLYSRPNISPEEATAANQLRQGDTAGLREALKQLTEKAVETVGSGKTRSSSQRKKGSQERNISCRTRYDGEATTLSRLVFSLTTASFAVSIPPFILCNSFSILHAPLWAPSYNRCAAGVLTS